MAYILSKSGIDSLLNPEHAVGGTIFFYKIYL